MTSKLFLPVPIVASLPPPFLLLLGVIVVLHSPLLCLAQRQPVWLLSWQLSLWSYLPGLPQRDRPPVVPTGWRSGVPVGERL
jgi:hypothetical protein